jgi:hypothetical protein
MKSSLQSLIPFLLTFYQPANSEDSTLISVPLLPRSYPNSLASRNSTESNDLRPFYNHFARITQKTQPLYCSERVFTALLHNKGSYSIVACVFIATGMCLPSSCLAIDVSSDFTIPAFGRHVTKKDKTQE